jgi:hypothetical protein
MAVPATPARASSANRFLRPTKTHTFLQTEGWCARYQRLGRSVAERRCRASHIKEQYGSRWPSGLQQLNRLHRHMYMRERGTRDALLDVESEHVTAAVHHCQTLRSWRERHGGEVPTVRAALGHLHYRQQAIRLRARLRGPYATCVTSPTTPPGRRHLRALRGRRTSASNRDANSSPHRSALSTRHRIIRTRCDGVSACIPVRPPAVNREEECIPLMCAARYVSAARSTARPRCTVEDTNGLHSSAVR